MKSFPVTDRKWCSPELNPRLPLPDFILLHYPEQVTPRKNYILTQWKDIQLNKMICDSGCKLPKGLRRAVFRPRWERLSLVPSAHQHCPRASAGTSRVTHGSGTQGFAVTLVLRWMRWWNNTALWLLIVGSGLGDVGRCPGHCSPKKRVSCVLLPYVISLGWFPYGFLALAPCNIGKQVAAGCETCSPLRWAHTISTQHNRVWCFCFFLTFNSNSG